MRWKRDKVPSPMTLPDRRVHGGWMEWIKYMRRLRMSHRLLVFLSVLFVFFIIYFIFRLFLCFFFNIDRMFIFCLFFLLSVF